MDAHLLKVNEVWDQNNLLALKADTASEGNTVYLDPLPFDKSTSLKKLPDLMQSWFQGCLGKYFLFHVDIQNLTFANRKSTWSTCQRKWQAGL